MLIPILFSTDPSSLGWIGGTAPNGLVTLNGTPGRAELIVMPRSSLAVFATTRSNELDGTYQLDGLTMGVEYTVVARDPTRTWKDMIEGAVLPTAYT